MPAEDVQDLDEVRPIEAVTALLDNALTALDKDSGFARRCLMQASSLIRRESTADRPPRGGLVRWQSLRVEAHVRDHLHATLRIQDAAALCRLSVSHFNRAFKATFGITFGRYVQRQRLEHAKFLMLATETPLSQIALDCGLSDQAHFTRLFGRQIGETPAAWRRRMRVPAAAHPKAFVRAEGKSI